MPKIKDYSFEELTQMKDSIKANPSKWHPFKYLELVSEIKERTPIVAALCD